MTRLTTLGAAACFTLLACMHTSNPVAQDRAHLLKEKVEQGAVRSVQAKRDVTLRLTISPGTPYAVTNDLEVHKQSLIHEWNRSVQDGRATEVWRSYVAITANEVTYTDLGNGPERVTTPATEWKRDQTVAMKVAKDGTREITHETWDFVGERDRRYIQLDREADLLPGREVKVGESWNAPAGGLGLIAYSGPDDKITSSDIKVTFKGTKQADNGDTLAQLTVSGTVNFKTEAASPMGADYATDLTAEASLSGGAIFNITSGHMLGYAWTGNATSRGRWQGSDIASTAEFSESDDYSYGMITDKPVDNGSAGPGEATEVKGFPSAAVDPDHVVIARNDGKIARIQVLDPSTGKIVRTLMVMPGSFTLNNLALSPDRKRVAFASSLNGLISLNRTNVFVLELATGEVNQVSPHWADNKGITKPISTGKTATLTGRVVWKDTDPQVNRDRNDGFTGYVRIDQTPCIARVADDGTFTVTSVPVGVALLLEIRGSLPFNFTNGKPRGGTDSMARTAGTSMASLLIDEDGKNLGEVRLQTHYGDRGVDRPNWDGDTLWINESAWTSCYKVGYPEHSWKQVQFGELTLLFGGFAVSPDGKQAAFCRDSSGGAGSVWMFDTKGKHLWHADVANATLSFGAEGAWTSDGYWVCTAGIENTMGKELYGAPALVIAIPQNKQATLLGAWPQLAGHRMVSVCVDKSASIASFVTLQTVPGKSIVLGNLWQWNALTNSLVRLTSLNDVVAVASYGR
ncbi:MAG: PD40 domain-containing protein [Planctomycetes bacterium]|nr:PD40 domain-containing protein [Planctomycetota bacterium]